MFNVSLVVTQLEAGKGAVVVEPYNEVEVVREKPAAPPATGNLTDVGVFPHYDSALFRSN
jgi:hypothetical protein